MRKEYQERLSNLCEATLQGTGFKPESTLNTTLLCLLWWWSWKVYFHLKVDLLNAASAKGISLLWYNYRQWKQFGGHSGFISAFKSCLLPWSQVCMVCIHFLVQQISVKFLLCTGPCARQEESREWLDQEWKREAMKHDYHHNLFPI